MKPAYLDQHTGMQTVWPDWVNFVSWAIVYFEQFFGKLQKIAQILR
jgi:hypothetical protein